jgi:transposase
MMGDRLVMQESLFYEFRLDEHVPADHMLRAIDRFVDLDGLRQHLVPFYSATGRPSIDPELMIRMLFVGYCFGIRSERRLCEEVHLNLAYRWFCRLGLDGKVPDHSTFSKNRHGRFRESDAFRHVFETVVSRCIEEGLVGGEGFAVDASLIAADANKQRSVSSTEHIDWSSLAASRRAVREYLDTLDDAAWGTASEAVPKFVSRSDPAAQWTGAHKGHAFFAYADNYLIDLKAAIILDVEATRAIRQAEVGAARTMEGATAPASSWTLSFSTISAITSHRAGVGCLRSSRERRQILVEAAWQVCHLSSNWSPYALAFANRARPPLPSVSPRRAAGGTLINGPLRQRQPRQDIGEYHAHASTDADPLDLGLRREHAVRPRQVADHAEALLLGRLAALRVQLDQQHEIRRVLLKCRLNGMVDLGVGMHGAAALD